MTDELTGIALDENFDLRIDTTGDIDATTTSIEELAKDLSLRIATIIDDVVLGNRLRPNQIAELEAEVTNTVIADTRVDDVVTVNVSRDLASTTADVVVELDAEGESFTVVV